LKGEKTKTTETEQRKSAGKSKSEELSDEELERRRKALLEQLNAEAD
jgi:hypothetical protein